MRKPKKSSVSVRMVSMAMTGYFYTTTRSRAGIPLSLMKYDPIIKRHVLFLEQKRSGHMGGQRTGGKKK